MSQRQRRDDNREGNGETNEDIHLPAYRKMEDIRRNLPDTRLIIGLLTTRRTVNAATSRTLDLELMVGLWSPPKMSWYRWVLC